MVIIILFLEKKLVMLKKRKLEIIAIKGFEFLEMNNYWKKIGHYNVKLDINTTNIFINSQKIEIHYLFIF